MAARRFGAGPFSVLDPPPSALCCDSVSISYHAARPKEPAVVTVSKKKKIKFKQSCCGKRKRKRCRRCPKRA